MSTSQNNLSKEPSIQIIKAGNYQLNDMGELLNASGVKSQIGELSVTENKNALTVGFFTMEPGNEFEYLYEDTEYKVVTKGKFVLRDKDDNKYVAEVGDVILFTPNVTVIFDGESDGEAIYTAHRDADASFAAK